MIGFYKVTFALILSSEFARPAKRRCAVIPAKYVHEETTKMWVMNQRRCVIFAAAKLEHVFFFLFVKMLLFSHRCIITCNYESRYFYKLRMSPLYLHRERVLVHPRRHVQLLQEPRMDRCPESTFKYPVVIV